MKYVSIDIETTGDDLIADQIVEFAAVIDDTDWFKRQNPIPVEQLPSFQTYIINDDDRYYGKSIMLGMHKLIWERIANRTKGYNYMIPEKVTIQFYDFLYENGFQAEEDNNKIWFNVAGKNYANFDQQFIEQQLPDWNEILKNHRRVIDPAILYYKDGDTKLPDTKTCIERAGLNDPVSHEALADAQTVIRLIRNKL